jgi:hypothetical protein
LLEEGSMTTLTLALVAAMAVGSDGKERISDEMQFCIEGSWEGTLQGTDLLGADGGTWPSGRWFIESIGTKNEGLDRLVDEGRGRLRWEDWRGQTNAFGIYKLEATRLVICLGADYPTEFWLGANQIKLTLKRAKSPG